MRIGIGQLWQETNTFNPLPTTVRDFEPLGLYHGAEIIEKLANTNEIGGFIQSLRKWPERPEIVGLVRLPAWPSGPATAETFDWLVEQMTTALRNAGPLDGVLLALHGAMVADEHPDVEGDFLQAVREVIGPQVPLVATLDLHANVTERMVRNADVLVVFHTAPHIDVFETGERGAAVLHRLLVDGVRPTSAMVKLPFVPPAERANTQEPTSVSFGLRKMLEELERRPNVLAAGLATVQPWLDIPELGSTVLVSTVDDRAAAVAESERVAGEVWDRRRDYLPELVDAAEAVRRAQELPSGLTVISDAADATTSGAPGDSTWLLRELLKYRWPRGAVVTVVAPEVVAQCETLPLGATLTTPLGGRRDARFSQPVDVAATVERLFDARFVLSGHLGKNLPIEMGRAVVLKSGDVRIVVTERSGPHFAPELFRAAAIDPYSLQVLIAKSPCGFRAVYAERAAQILLARAPGCAPSDFWNYPYHRIPRPLWPWDEIEAWRPQAKTFAPSQS